VSGRAAPFYCPYCGEEDIRPDGEGHGQWRCGACTRVWTLRLVGLSADRPPIAPATSDAASAAPPRQNGPAPSLGSTGVTR
jgi:transposase-like protein